MIRLTFLREIVKMALDSIKTHRLRSFLTILGIVIGVMTVIGMVAVIQGLNASFLSELRAAGSDVIIVQKTDRLEMGFASEEMRKRKNLTYDDAQAIGRDCPLIKSVSVTLSPAFYESIDIKYRNAKSDGSFIMGVNENFPTVYSIFLPKEGRNLIPSDILHSNRVCVLGFELAEILFPHEQAVGKEIRIGPEKFEVVGVMNKRGEIFGLSRDNLVLIPITALMKYFPYDLATLSIAAVPRKQADMEEAQRQISDLLRRRRKVGFGKPDDFVIMTQDTIIGLYRQVTGAAYLVMILISSIGLLVGGIGVMNIMLVSVKERTREIGIRKAIGARSRDILKQFLIESVVLTGTGGILGIAAGFMVAVVVRAATPLPAVVTFWSVATGFTVSVCIGLFFGVFPAQKAANLDPVVSLRYE